jgi:hypothetical protein
VGFDWRNQASKGRMSFPFTMQYLLARMKVDPATGCWLWTRCKNAKGYGYFCINRKRENAHHRAHRAIWEIVKGPIPVGYFVCHRCDQPSCLNPDHLFLGTAEDNSHDMMRKECHCAKLDKAQAMEIFNSSEMGSKLAKKFGVTQTCISGIRHGKIYKWIAEKDSNA